MNRSRSRPLALVVLLTLAWVGAAPVFAASVTIRVGSVEAAPGEVAEVPVTLVGSPGIGAMHLELTYDPALMAVEGVVQGSLVAGNALTAFNTDEPGRIIISLAAADEIAGDGTLAIASFLVSGEKGQSSAVGLEYSQAWDGEGFELAVELEPGQLTVGSAGLSPLLLVALVVLALVLIVGLALVLALVRRGRRRVPAEPAYVPHPRRPPSPGAQAPTTAPRFCGHCGQPREPGKRFCVHCGQPVDS